MVWHAQYAACCEELAQWDALAELGKACQDAGALLGSLWKLGEYDYLATNVLQGAAVGPHAAPSWDGPGRDRLGQVVEAAPVRLPGHRRACL